MLITAGAIIATVPESLIKADNDPTDPMIITNSLGRLFPARDTILVLIVSANPLSRTAPPTMNKAAIVITMGLEKPSSASSIVRIPVSINPRTTPRATRSTESNSVINKMIAIARIAKVNQISAVIRILSH
jgi:hypothetical protein